MGLSWHHAWHVAVLGVTLVAAAGAIIVLLGPILFDAGATATRRARPLVWALVVLAMILVGAEWLLVHGRFL
jgi:hypothetical protein